MATHEPIWPYPFPSVSSFALNSNAREQLRKEEKDATQGRYDQFHRGRTLALDVMEGL
jgi:hypothetical protein